MNGLFLLKQLLKFNDTPNVDKLFALLVDTCSQEELIVNYTLYGTKCC